MISAIAIRSPTDRDPAVRAGRPKIAGTGVTVMRVAAWYKMGLSPEGIATQYGHLSLAQVHAALAYYHANPEEIEADLSEEEAFAVGARIRAAHAEMRADFGDLRVLMEKNHSETLARFAELDTRLTRPENERRIVQ